MYERVSLKEKTEVDLWGVDRKRRFTIKKFCAWGGSVAVYDAMCDGVSGILKEFYPKNYLTRGENGGLELQRPDENILKEYEKAKMEYLAPYKLVQEAKQINPNLESFIPYTEIYSGCDLDGDPSITTYIWTPESKVQEYLEWYKDVLKDVESQTDEKLYNVLAAMLALTQCIGELHNSGLLHCDIKPSNFGINKNGSKLNFHSVSLYDIDSVKRIDDKRNEFVYTEGYGAPERNNSIKSDIYSIGATIFNSFMVFDGGDNEMYADDSYINIPVLVKNSKLIGLSIVGEDPVFADLLVYILQKCLGDIMGRYTCCSDLEDDLQSLIERYAFVKNGGTDNLRTVADIEKKAYTAIQYMFYKYPLYSFCKTDDGRLNILVLGFGTNAQKFLSLCLQMGQMCDKLPRVIVAGASETDKKFYLKKNPEIENFFTVSDNSKSVADNINNIDESYGLIEFVNAGLLSQTGRREKEQRISRYISNQSRLCDISYVFIDIDNDQVNKKVAEDCRDILIKDDSCCYISYIQRNSKERTDEEYLVPVNVSEDITKSEEYKDIDRMALNAHMVWEKDLNVLRGDVMKSFRKPYNYSSCVSNVVHLKYKLYGLGIDIDELGFVEAANECQNKLQADIDDTGVSEYEKELVCVEHRRWVTEKITQGWRCNSDIEDCVKNGPKNERARTHACIVTSEKGYDLDKYDKWDDREGSSLEGLDELEKMSVELHRGYKKKAAAVDRSMVIANLNEMRKLSGTDGKSATAFAEWEDCIRDILTGDRYKAKLFGGLTGGLKKAACDNKAMLDRVRLFVREFNCVVESLKYRDYKKDDVALVRAIPFILTYNRKVKVVIPYTSEESLLFENVASILMINPAYVVYCCYIQNDRELEALDSSIGAVTSFIEKKKLVSGITFLTGYCSELSDKLKGRNKDYYKTKSSFANISAIFRECNDETDFAECVDEYIAEKQGKGDAKDYGSDIVMVEKNSTRESYLLSGAGLYKKYDNYRFDSADQKFVVNEGCTMLRYLTKKPYVGITDMFSIKQSMVKGTCKPDEFISDYEDLWNKYRNGEGTSIWKNLSNILSEYHDKNDVIASFIKRGEGKKERKYSKLVYRMPALTGDSLGQMLTSLEEYKIIEPGSGVSMISGDCCQVTILDRCDNKQLFDRLFSNAYFFLIKDAITIDFNARSHMLNVRYDNLIVENVQIDSYMEDLLRFFERKNYIFNVRISEGEKASFTYSTFQTKDLMSKAGRMLEVYVYNKLRADGRFDDITSGLEFVWEGTAVRNEIDCIVTKGFRSIWIECKVRPDIDQNYYFKLEGIARKFGINATAVLIADTEEKPIYDTAAINRMQRQRGDMLDVVTVWKKDDIENISETLEKILDGTYGSSNG